MKKAISILLTIIMLMSCAPVFVLAADTTWTGTITLSTATTIGNGDNVTLTGTVTVATTLTVAAGGSLTIAQNGSLVITGGGRLINNGEINIRDRGVLNISGGGTTTATAAFVNNGTINLASGTNFTLASNAMGVNYGTIGNIDRMTVTGTLYHNISIPGSFSVGYLYTETWNRADTNVSFDVKYVRDTELTSDLEYTDPTKYHDAATVTSVLVTHGEKLYILITPEDGDGNWIDIGRMQLSAGGQTINNDRGVFCIQPTNSLSVSVSSTAYKHLVKMFEIELPRTEGYYVITYGGDVDTCQVEYGKTLSFRVVLAPEYDKSDYSVYVNTAYMEPDEFGYYDITGPILNDDNGNAVVATAGGVQQDITIYVMGMTSNSMQDTFSRIVDFLRQIFTIISEIFADIFGALNINVG